MTFEEALINRKECLAYLKGSRLTENNRNTQAVELCIEALEKQVAKKVIHEVVNEGHEWIAFFLNCPVCGAHTEFEKGEREYCSACGQRLED